MAPDTSGTSQHPSQSESSGDVPLSDAADDDAQDGAEDGAEDAEVEHDEHDEHDDHDHDGPAHPARPTRLELTRQRSAELFAVLHDEGTGDAERSVARDDLVRLHLPLVEHCARRFRNRGEPFEDLVQVGTIGLIKSVDRFDSERGVEFSTYATPTVIGEIKRHFRDKGWAIRVPRRLQELRMQINGATAELSQSLGRSPTAGELAGAIGCSVEEIIEGLESSNAYSTMSLDVGGDTEDGPPSILDSLGHHDEALDSVEMRESIRPLLDRLPAREKQILMLRFFRNKTQSEIAAEIGVSQMHVSRLLTKTLAAMRESLAED